MEDEAYMDQGLSKDLEMLDIDMDMGIKYCGDQDFYREILAIAYESYMDRYPKLGGYFEVADYKNYTILVHSIKSGAANIGAMKLSNMAKALEEAGKNEDYDYITHNHQFFMDYYHNIMTGLADVLKLKKDNSEDGENEQCCELKDITAETWKESLNNAYYYLEELELDAAAEVIDELLCYRLKQSDKELLNSIKNHLGSFGVERAKEILHILLDEN